MPEFFHSSFAIAHHSDVEERGVVYKLTCGCNELQYMSCVVQYAERKLQRPLTGTHRNYNLISSIPYHREASLRSRCCCTRDSSTWATHTHRCSPLTIQLTHFLSPLSLRYLIYCSYGKTSQYARTRTHNTRNGATWFAMHKWWDRTNPQMNQVFFIWYAMEVNLGCYNVSESFKH